MAKKQSEETKKSPFKTVIQNLGFHNFEDQKTFTGMYKDTVTLGDEEDPEKTFQANVFVDLDSGEEVYIQNSYSIAKSIKMAKAEYKDTFREVVFSIEFLGKTTVKGKPFNQFKIGYCTMEEWDTFNA